MVHTYKPSAYASREVYLERAYFPPMRLQHSIVLPSKFLRPLRILIQKIVRPDAPSAPDRPISETARDALMAQNGAGCAKPRQERRDRGPK